MAGRRLSMRKIKEVLRLKEANTSKNVKTDPRGAGFDITPGKVGS
jgi:hypothetical protein